MPCRPNPAGAEPPRLWLVTRGAQAAGDRPLPLCLAQSPVWGMGRVIAVEHPALACTRIDLDPEDRRDASEQLVEEICRGQGEDQVVYRGGERHVARLQSLRDDGADGLQVPHGRPYRLEITGRGQLDNVILRPAAREQPGPGQVEIRVRATGLNFRDVLNVLDLYPGDPGPLGGECAGEITAVGPGVERFKPGDAVVALAPASFATYALTLAEFVALKPQHLSFEEAATIPICFLTAELALRRLGRLQPGERVLIHAASGGVGLAAIQIARQVGAEIFATAGNPRKREYLRSLGIEHVMDSRSLEFAPQIMEATRRRGNRSGGQLADRRNDRRQSLRAPRRRTLHGTGQDRPLGPGAGGPVQAGREVLPDRAGPHDGRRAAERRPDCWPTSCRSSTPNFFRRCRCGRFASHASSTRCDTWPAPSTSAKW